jgi:CheY-like chemotaxis protein
MKQILVATHSERNTAIQAAFGEGFQLIFCDAIADAVANLHEEIRLILCNIHFGDGDMYTLLRHAKAEDGTREIPFVCIDDSSDELPPSLRQSVEIATRALGAETFISFANWKAVYGEREAFERAGEVIRGLLRRKEE